MIAADRAALPENLTHCSECGGEFDEPAYNWDDFFVHIDDASFMCQSCGKDAERNADGSS